MKVSSPTLDGGPVRVIGGMVERRRVESWEGGVVSEVKRFP